MTDNQGLSLATDNAEARAAYNRAVTDMLEYRLSAMPALKEALEHDPSFCMAHCFRGYLLMTMGTFTVLDSAGQALQKAKETSTSASDRERRHVRALEKWHRTDLEGACAEWESILIDYPVDILALRMHHYNSFWMGRARALVSAPASVLPSWSPDMPNHGNVLGMIAFGLEECGQYEAAERYGREAVAINSDDLWSVHSVAHVLEMQERHDEGLDWLDLPAEQWSDRNPFRGHLWWHLGLFNIRAGRFRDAVELYDTSIYDQQSSFYLDIQNAASFLRRLEFEGIDVGNRWDALVAHAREHKHDHALAFTDIHCVMSLARQGHYDEAREMIESMRAYAGNSDLHTPRVIRKVAADLCEGIVAFEAGEDEQALDTILPLRPLVWEVGASHAQRDIVTQYVIQAARRANLPNVERAIRNEQRFSV